MRTVVENRVEINNISETPNSNYVHLSEQPLRSRSCFYDFGARQQVRVIYSSDTERSDFMESLMEEVHE